MATQAELAAQGSTLSPRQQHAFEREQQLRRALNQAAALPSSQAIVIEPDDSESLAAIRASLARLLEVEPRSLNWGVRQGRIIITKAQLPPRRGRGA